MAFQSLRCREESLRCREESLRCGTSLLAVTSFVTSFGAVTPFTSMSALAALQQYGGSDDSSDESTAEKWNGDVPEWTDEWNKSLHQLITSVYGDGRETGIEPLWEAGNDGEFLGWENYRRNLPHVDFEKLAWLPYYDTLNIAEYKTGSRNSVVEATLFGTGEKFGEWDAFMALIPAPTGKGTLPPLYIGKYVSIGIGANKVTVARILRATKPAGRPDEGRTQQCFYVLLYDGKHFQYAALQHVKDCWPGGQGVDLAWLAEETTFYEGYMQPGTTNKLQHFKPKSVSAAAKLAASYVSKFLPEKAKKRAQQSASGGDGKRTAASADGSLRPSRTGASAAEWKRAMADISDDDAEEDFESEHESENNGDSADEDWSPGS